MRKGRKQQLIGIAIVLGIVICLILVATKVIPANKNISEVQNPIESEKVEDTQSVLAETSEDSQTIEPETETAALETEEPEPQITLVMVGDMLMHTKVLESGKQDDGSYNFEHLFQYVKDDIEAADLALVNQETIIGGEELGISSYPCFNSPYELADAEVNTGFDVVLQATNHALDKGKQGVINDIDNWKEKYPQIACLGIFESEQESENDIFYYEKDGIRIAVLNYTYGTNGINPPSDMPYIVNYLDENKVISDLAEAGENADFVMVCPHWGTEYNLGISSEQEYWTKIFLENGVDLVIGTHPHVIEPVKWVSDDAGNQMLVYYSLGNFVNGTESNEGRLTTRMVGGLAEVTIGRDETGNAAILSYGVEPLVCHMSYGDEYTVYYLSDYTEELAEKNRIRGQYPEFSLEDCKSVVEEVWE